MNILFIISGSIAIKKNYDILDILKKKKINVDCIITESAKKIINLKLLKKSINGKIYSNSSEKKNKMLHIQLTRKNNILVVCPATANIIAKLANGFADDLASTALIASNKQIIVVPAMNVEMWNNKTNLNNIRKLKKQGIEIIGPEYGFLSCGEIGIGRMSHKYKISSIINDFLSLSKELSGKKCIVTAGPTIESIDPIRYISNYSSGKQGYEIAKQLSLSGAKVILITGPTNISFPSNIKIINIKTAKEMNTAVLKNLPVDVAIFTAAVSDIKPKKNINYKIKKENLQNIQLIKNPDIIKNSILNKKKRPKLTVGFSLETHNEINNSEKKLKSKKLDWIILNKLTKKNKIFGSDYNKITILKKEKKIELKKMTKVKIAKKLVKEIIYYFK